MGFHVKYPLILSNFNENLNLLKILEKYSNINFHEISFSGSRVVACERTDGRKERQTDRHDAFRNFANMTKNENTKEILILLLIVISTVCMEYF